MTVRQRAEAMAADPEDCPNMPPDWGFFNDDQLVERAFARWAASGFSNDIPAREQVLDTDPEWEADLLLRYRLQKRIDYFAKADRAEG